MSMAPLVETIETALIRVEYSCADVRHVVARVDGLEALGRRVIEAKLRTAIEALETALQALAKVDDDAPDRIS